MITSRTLSANGLDFLIDEAGEGEDVALCLHGFPEARGCWGAQLPHLAKLGWRAVAPDLRGYGGTTRPGARSAYEIEKLVDDVAGLFDALGAGRRLLIGHDWGGVIAWQVALRRRADLDGLVILNAPHPAVFHRVLNAGWRQRLRSWYVLFFQLPAIPEWQLTANNGQALIGALSGQARAFSPELLETYRANLLRPGAATAMLNYYRANAVKLAAPPAPGPPLETPTLMIWGENDVALDIALTEGNEAFVADFTLRRIPDASHWVLQDAPDQVNAVLADWLATKALLP